MARSARPSRPSRGLLALFAAALAGVPMATMPAANTTTPLAARVQTPAAQTSATQTSATDASAAQTDFNGDGYADLAVGVPAATVAGQTNAGYVNVVWGGPSGLDSAGSATFGQAKSWIPGEVQKNDRFGSAVEAVDVNGDAYTDLAVSSPGESLTTRRNARQGTVTVVLGSATGFSTAFVAAKGPSWTAELGKQVATGDFDNDGDQDLAMSMSGLQIGSVWLRPGPLAPGSPRDVEVLRNLPEGGRVNDLAAADFDGNGTQDLAFTWTATDDMGTTVLRWVDGVSKRLLRTTNAGVSLAAADFWQDGYVDLVLGQARNKPGDVTYCADDPGGLVRTLHAQTGDILGGTYQCTTQDSPAVPGASEDGDRFGAAVTSDDMDGDLFPELAIGAPHEGLAGRAQAGTVTVITGSGHGPWSGDGTHQYHQDTPGLPGAVEAGDRFGAALATDDYNGDGLADLAVGAPGENARSGGVWYIPGPQGASSTGVRALTPATLGLSPQSSALFYGAVLND